MERHGARRSGLGTVCLEIGAFFSSFSRGFVGMRVADATSMISTAHMRRIALGFLGSLFIAACGGSVEDAKGTATADTGTSSETATTLDVHPGDPPTPGEVSIADPPPTPGKPVFDEKVVHLRLAKVNLGGAPWCTPEFRSVDYDRSTMKMSWPGCASADGDAGRGTPYPSVERLLTPDEAVKIEIALHALTWRDPPPCGSYDGREYFLTTTSSDGDEQKYSAYDINCTHYRVAPGIVDLYALFEAFRG